MPKMEHTDNCIYTRYFLIMLNIEITRMHSNIYTNIIFIGMRVKITVYTGKYPETPLILLNIRNFSGVTMNYPSSSFSVHF